MKRLSIMIKPASSLCNMRCRYCFYADVSQRRALDCYGVMSHDTARAVIQNALRDLTAGDELTFAFQGGEPTLAGLEFFQFFVEEVERRKGSVRVRYAIQTNGLLLDDGWCAFLRTHRFLVGLSLDGDAVTHNKNRLCADGTGSHARVMAALRRLRAHRVDYNIVCVLTAEAARHPQRLWSFFEKEGAEYLQFIPCLDGLEAGEETPWALTPRRFYGFYSALYPLWRRALAEGKPVSVKLFDDITSLYSRGQVTACGMHGRCQPQYVVEADGSLYPCDFYVLDGYRVGNLTEMGLRQAFDKLAACGFAESHAALLSACGTCRYAATCHGGCKRMKRTMYVDAQGYCGFRHLLDDVLEDLCALDRHMARYG